MADLQTGIGRCLAVFLASVRHFNPAAVGVATAAGGFATVLMQTPARAITDATTRKRLLVALVVWVFVAADLARGTGRFHLMQGVFANAQGLGGAFSNVAAGFLATAFGFPATFLTLAAVAACAFMVFVVRMPETCAAGGRATPASAAA